MKNFLKVIALFLLITATAQAQSEQERQELERQMARFELFTGYAPVRLLVEDLPENAAEIGLTRQAITTTVRSRLRGARIYNSEIRYPYLYVNVNVVGRAHSISLELNQVVFSPAAELSGSVTTWNVGMTGTHGGPGSSYILQGVGQVTDLFIDEYLAVN